VARATAWVRGVIHCVGIIRERAAQGVTFERFNGEAAINVAREAQAAGVGRFVFLSAAQRRPG